ncbi:hypothetical protein A3J91_04455 [Candidatus Peribacteria bacterium RIFOXYC2_FULL_58_10]|nr:MAG: hypothetical protein A3J91_04455 [Candidatus Peribacteria bacterium RIFOXYC2_FULL_58_10]OGJ83966.1 MAG: hypothetical protein A2529_04165 [Candidatus Peribacteria bacterium RIFOXYD2_FULL_58_15]
MSSQRTIALLLAVFMTFGSVAHAWADYYPDTAGTMYDAGFAYLTEKGIVQGYSDGSGRPEAAINRAEALKIILGLKDPARVKKFQANMPPLPLFSDIDQRAWYASYVEAAFETRMVTGYPDRTFRPGRYLTVEEAVTMLLRAYGSQGTQGAAQLSPYIQNEDGEWFTPFINAAIGKNLVMHSGRLELGTAITRGSFFDMAYRIDDIQSKGQTAFQGSEPSSVVVGGNQTTIISMNNPSIRAPQPANLAGSSERYFAINMPTLGISDLTVTHPTDPFSKDGILQPLNFGVGHLFGYPGGGGKIMIYGHSSGYPWDVSQFTKIFRKVNQLKVGDRISVAYNGKLYGYEVSYSQTIPADDTSPFKDDGRGEELILYTCWPPDSITQRYLVHALPVSSAVAVR